MALPMIAYGALAGLQLLSGVQQANAIQKQAELQRQIDQFNIEQAQLDAFQAEADGYTQMARYQNVIDEIEAQQRVQYAAAGVSSNFGSASDIQAESELNAKLNLLDIQSQAHKRALGYQKEANQRRGQSELNMIGADLQAITARNTAILNAGGTLLGGAERNGLFTKNKPLGLTGYEKANYSGNYGSDYNWQYGGMPVEEYA